jgi:hypothetical protein
MIPFTWCTVAWGDVAEYLQFAAIVITGGAAVFVANRQLSAYNFELRKKTETERLQLTLKVLDDLFAANPISIGVTSSPWTSLGVIEQAMHYHRRQYDDSLAAWLAGKLLDETDLTFMRDAFTNAAVLLNYFALVEALLVRDLVDSKLLLEKLGSIVRKSMAYVKSMRVPGLNLDDITSLDSRAAEFYEPDGTEKRICRAGAGDPATPVWKDPTKL